VIGASLRRALVARDGGCRFPGCTNRRYVDAHHVRHWVDGGETSLDNTILVCSAHHALIHEGGFQARTDGADIRFLAPNGREISPAGLPPAVTTALPTVSAAATVWDGQPVDLDAAVSCLL
jgi:hypothetical protein